MSEHSLSDEQSEEDDGVYITWMQQRSPGEAEESHVVSSEKDWENFCGAFLEAMGDCPVVGLDLEGYALYCYKRDMQQGRRLTAELPEIAHDNLRAERPAMLQLATLGGFAVVIRLSFFRRIPTSLQEILGKESIFKIGVNIQGDVHWFLERWGVKIRGWLDLRNICKEAEMRIPQDFELKGRLGLKHLAWQFFGDLRFSIKHMKSISHSNWARLVLTEDQLYYAVFDAQVAVDICGVIIERLIPGIEITENGKKLSTEEHLSQLRTFLKQHLHSGFSRSEFPIQACKVDDLVSPNASDDERSANFREYMFEVSDTLTDGDPDAEIPGLERSLRSILRSERGRLPAFVRAVAASLQNNTPFDPKCTPPPGYATAIESKLRDDRVALLPAKLDGRYPSNYWVQVPKLCRKIGSEFSGGPLATHKVFNFSDVFHCGEMAWAWEYELTRTLKYKRRLPISDEEKAAHHKHVKESNKNLVLPVKVLHAPEDKFAEVDESVSQFGCLLCGERKAQRLLYEAVVPESYIQLYPFQYSCRCNWARVCSRCAHLWRLTQLETMLELGAVLQASVEMPKFISADKEIKARSSAKKLVALETSANDTRVSVDRTERFGLFKDLCRYTGERYVNPKGVLETIDDNWYEVNQQMDWHEAQVIKCLEAEVSLVERIYRSRFNSLSKFVQPINPEHLCLAGKKRQVIHCSPLDDESQKRFTCDLDSAMGDFDFNRKESEDDESDVYDYVEGDYRSSKKLSWRSRGREPGSPLSRGSWNWNSKTAELKTPRGSWKKYSYRGEHNSNRGHGGYDPRKSHSQGKWTEIRIGGEWAGYPHNSYRPPFNERRGYKTGYQPFSSRAHPTHAPRNSYATSRCSRGSRSSSSSGRGYALLPLPSVSASTQGTENNPTETGSEEDIPPRPSCSRRNSSARRTFFCKGFVPFVPPRMQRLKSNGQDKEQNDNLE